MNRFPWMKFYPGDYMHDTRTLTQTEKGCWMDLICHLWIADCDGRMRIGYDELARLWGKPTEAAAREMIEALARKRICEIEHYDGAPPATQNAPPCNAGVMVTSRRMSREAKHHELNRKRVDRHRVKRRGNADVMDEKSEVRSHKRQHPPSPSPMAGTLPGFQTATKPAKKVDLYDQPGFAEFWDAYPNHNGKHEAARAWKKATPSGELFDRIMAAVAVQVEQDAWTKDGGRYIPRAATWLNGRRWEDEISNAPTGGLPTWQEKELDRIHKKSSMT